nr:hypothetical protein [Enterococcus sp. FDAARGOS_375]
MKKVIVQYGGVSLNRLCQQLEENQIHLNAYANQLLRHPQLSFSADKQRAACVIVPLKELGLPQGGSLTEIFAAAPSYGLTCCTLEMALHFRLSYRPSQRKLCFFTSSRDCHRKQSLVFFIYS